MYFTVVVLLIMLYCFTDFTISQVRQIIGNSNPELAAKLITAIYCIALIAASLFVYKILW